MFQEKIIFIQILLENLKERMLNSFYEVSLSLELKTDKDSVKKEKNGPGSFTNTVGKNSEQKIVCLVQQVFKRECLVAKSGLARNAKMI